MSKAQGPNILRATAFLVVALVLYTLTVMFLQRRHTPPPNDMSEARAIEYLDSIDALARQKAEKRASREASKKKKKAKKKKSAEKDAAPVPLRSPLDDGM